MNSLRLKNETKEYHDRTERVMNSNLLFSNEFTIDHYKTFILKSHDYIITIKNIVCADWNEYDDIFKRKQNALDIDLQHLELNNTVYNNTAVKNKEKYYSLGLVYIMLGAMLGNKIILKKLQEYPIFTNYPFAYLSEQQDDFSAIWKDFQSIINNLDENDLNKVINGAKDGYILFSE